MLAGGERTLQLGGPSVAAATSGGQGAAGYNRWHPKMVDSFLGQLRHPVRNAFQWMVETSLLFDRSHGHVRDPAGSDGAER